jgi:hypothetical protein
MRDAEMRATEAHGSSPGLPPAVKSAKRVAVESDRFRGQIAAGSWLRDGRLVRPFSYAAIVAAVRLNSHWSLHRLPGFPGDGAGMSDEKFAAYFAVRRPDNSPSLFGELI